MNHTSTAHPLLLRDRNDWVECFDRLGLAAAIVDDSAEIIHSGRRFNELFPRSESLLDPFAWPVRGELLTALCHVFAADEPVRLALERRVTLADADDATIHIWLLPVLSAGRRAILAVPELAPDQAAGTGAEEVLQELRGTVHDVNNLLTAAIGCAEMLACHEYYDEALERDSDELREVLGRAGQLMRQLLAELRGERTRDSKLLSTADWLRQREALFRGICGNQVSLELRVDANCWPIAIHPERFEQVMINLVTNAREACGTGGTVTISAENLILYTAASDQSPAERYVALTVEDSGCGFDLDGAERLFERGYTSKPGGHGIGLAHSLSYLQEIGALVEVQSRPGGGSRFKIQLPIARHKPDTGNVLPLRPSPTS